MTFLRELPMAIFIALAIIFAPDTEDGRGFKNAMERWVLS